MLDKEIIFEVEEVIDKYKDNLISSISDIIKINSVNPKLALDKNDSKNGESKVNFYTKNIMESMGIDVDIFEKEIGRHNLVGVYKGTGDGKSLLFNGHVDVVEADSRYWQKDPFGGEVDSGYLYGRGSVDMKSGNLAALFALKGLLAAGYEPKGDIIFQHVVGEETRDHESGTTACLDRGYIADAAVVCEPTNSEYRPYCIHPASPGIFEFEINIRGKSCHAGSRYEVVRDGGAGEEVGVDAIEKGLIIYNTLKDLEKKWGQTKYHHMFPVGLFCINGATISGGTSPGTVADIMTMEYSVFYPPQESPKKIKEEIENQIKNAIQNDNWLKKNPPEINWSFNWPSFNTDIDEDIIKVAKDSIKSIEPNGGEVKGFEAVCDASFIGAKDIPVIVLGPGDFKKAHVVDERISINEILDCAKIYALLILEWCGFEKTTNSNIRIN